MSKKFDDRLVNEGVDELLGMIDNGLETLRDYGKPWATLFEYEDVDHMSLIEEFERLVLIKVGEKLLEKREG